MKTAVALRFLDLAIEKKEKVKCCSDETVSDLLCIRNERGLTGR